MHPPGGQSPGDTGRIYRGGGDGETHGILKLGTWAWVQWQETEASSGWLCGSLGVVSKSVTSCHKPCVLRSHRASGPALRWKGLVLTGPGSRLGSSAELAGLDHLVLRVSAGPVHMGGSWLI